MGKVTGFMDYARQTEKSDAPVERIKHYREFLLRLDDQTASIEGARCMDCGIPFCHQMCPLHNVIPDWNDLVYQGQFREALDVLHSTNNFPDITGRVCPAPCEAGCTLGLNAEPVGIKSIEHMIADKGWENNWITPVLPQYKTGKRVAIVGSGPAGLAAAQQLARLGHMVVVFEKHHKVGGLLRYGIPDFKLEKHHVDKRIHQMQAEGVIFRTGVLVADLTLNNHALEHNTFGTIKEIISPQALEQNFDAIILAGGAEKPRDLAVPGRELLGIHFALDFLIRQNKINAQEHVPDTIQAAGKHVVVIGGGDTGSDCVGTANRQGALSVTQLEWMGKPPLEENKALTWPYWPMKLRTSSSHQEGCDRDWAVATKAFIGQEGRVSKLLAHRVTWQHGKMEPVANSEYTLEADLVLLALGFVSPIESLLHAFNVAKDHRGHVHTREEGYLAYSTSVPKVFASGDIRRGQSLVVWAIQEGRLCADAVDRFLSQ